MEKGDRMKKKKSISPAARRGLFRMLLNTGRATVCDICKATGVAGAQARKVIDEEISAGVVEKRARGEGHANVYTFSKKARCIITDKRGDKPCIYIYDFSHRGFTKYITGANTGRSTPQGSDKALSERVKELTRDCAVVSEIQIARLASDKTADDGGVITESVTSLLVSYLSACSEYGKCIVADCSEDAKVASVAENGRIILNADLSFLTPDGQDTYGYLCRTAEAMLRMFSPDILLITAKDLDLDCAGKVREFLSVRELDRFTVIFKDRNEEEILRLALEKGLSLI